MSADGKTTRQKLGNAGEDQAVEYLSGKGYAVIARNYRNRHQELDLIVEKDHTLVIAEVKSLKSDPLGAPEYRINRTKKRNIIKATWAFLGAHPQFRGFDVRFDVLIIDFSSYPARITHYEGAFIEN